LESSRAFGAVTSRLPPLDPTALTDRQKEVHGAIAAGPRGRVRGPFLALLHCPELADPLQRLGKALRFEGSLPAQLREFLILCVAHHWRCGYEWAVHVEDARKAGLAEQLIESIRAPSLPSGTPYEFVLARTYARQLLAEGTASKGAYADALARWGPERLVEITVLVGYYSLLAMTLNAHEIEAPGSNVAQRDSSRSEMTN
jgi:4-carboxymuconolactone decarboxylase